MDSASGPHAAEWLKPVRKTIRLPRDAYSQPGSAWLVTMSTADRTPIFSDPIVTGAVAALLLDVAEPRGVVVDLYCFMPDHAHLLAQVTDGDLLSTIQAFKSLSVRLWHDWGGDGTLWQRSFHDRGLRTTSDYDAAVHTSWQTRWRRDWRSGGRRTGRSAGRGWAASDPCGG